MQNKTLFITGASSGIGLETARYFSNKGWNIAATMRNPTVTDELKQIKNLKLYKLDVTDALNIDSVVKQAWIDFNGIDVVVNNAGYGAIGPFEAASLEQISMQMNTNFMGNVNIMKAFIPLFKTQKDGVFINISSIAGRVGMPLYSIYHASKFALEGLTESLYYELRPFGIKVRLVEPGPIKTEFNGRSRQNLVATENMGYETFTQKTNSLYEKVFSTAEHPIVVAKTIFKAANYRGSKIRFPSGVMAKFLLATNKIIPGSWLRVITRVAMGI